MVEERQSRKGARLAVPFHAGQARQERRRQQQRDSIPEFQDATRVDGLSIATQRQWLIRIHGHDGYVHHAPYAAAFFHAPLGPA